VNQLASAARAPDVRAASTTASSRQIPALDGIRGPAIIRVILHNATDDEFAAATGATRQSRAGEGSYFRGVRAAAAPYPR